MGDITDLSDNDTTLLRIIWIHCAPPIVASFRVDGVEAFVLEGMSGHLAATASLAVDQIGDLLLELAQLLLHLAHGNVEGVGNEALVFRAESVHPRL
jgi:hypothetical protein